MARASFVLVASAACGLLLATAPNATAARGGCAQYASNSGNDGASGRVDAPVRSIGRLLAGLHNGETGCLLPGWRFSEHVRVTGGGGLGQPIRIRGLGKSRPVLDGIVQVTRTGHDVTFQHISIQGDGTPSRAIVWVAGSHITFVGDEITGPRYHNASIGCIQVGGRARATVIRRARIHDCTRASTRRLYAPGIVVANATGTTIVDSVVFHTIGDAIVLAPHARGARVTHSIVDSNTSGVYIGGDSSGNVVADNVISFNGTWNVHGGGGGARGNVVTRNCLWKGFAGNVSGAGLVVRGNVVASPRYVARGRSFSIRPGGPCFSKRPRSFVPTRAAAPTAPRRLGRFVVHYRLRALPERVQIVELSFSGLQPGAALRLRCRSCKVVEHLVAGHGGTAASAALRGRWLGRGGVVEARETRSGFVAATARIVVTGLPRGVVVHHGSG